MEVDQKEFIANKQAEMQAAHVKMIKDRRDAVVEGLQSLLAQIEDGNVRAIGCIAVMKNGADFHSLHIEDGTSSPEILGLGARLGAIIANAQAQKG